MGHAWPFGGKHRMFYSILQNSSSIGLWRRGTGENANGIRPSSLLKNLEIEASSAFGQSFI
jgi:hypothetical protein